MQQFTFTRQNANIGILLLPQQLDALRLQTIPDEATFSFLRSNSRSSLHAKKTAALALSWYAFHILAILLLNSIFVSGTVKTGTIFVLECSSQCCSRAPLSCTWGRSKRLLTPSSISEWLISLSGIDGFSRISVKAIDLTQVERPKWMLCATCLFIFILVIITLAPFDLKRKPLN
jgi:hypothetical protein